MKKLLYSLLVVLLIPFAVRAEGEPNVVTVNTHAEDNGNIILYDGTTENSAHAVMCKLLDGNNEIDMRSVEVENNGTAGTFAGAFIAPDTGTYTIACANYEGGTIVSDEVTVENMTKVTVTFDTGDGANNEQVQVDVGGVVTRPNPDPTKEGKVFAGWYEDATYSTPFDFGTRITAHVTIYAKWNDSENNSEENIQLQVIFFGDGGTYQVDFEADDSINPEPLGEPVNSSHRYFVGEGKEVILTAIPAQGYHLVGWYNTHEEEDPNNPGQHIWTEDGLVSNQTEYVFTPTGEYVNLKLVFEEDTPGIYTVSFNTNGGSNITPIEISAGEKVERPQDPTNGNKIFAGWYEDETLTTEFDFNTPINANTTIYAKWENQKFTVTFNTNGGSTIESIEVEDGERANEPTNPTKNGLIFAGWYEEEELEHEFDFNNPITNNITIYAKWEKEYNLGDDNDNEVTFTDEPNQTLSLVVSDLTNLTDEELEEKQLDRETYETIIENLTNSAKKYGTLLSFLDISVLDNNNEPIEVGEVRVKLKLTDDLKGYKSYKLIYLDTDNNNNIVLSNSYTLTVEGDYLTGTLPHLSAYVLVGDNTEETTTITTTTNSPKTGDNIVVWIIVLAVSSIGILIGIISSLKTKKVK